VRKGDRRSGELRYEWWNDCKRRGERRDGEHRRYRHRLPRGSTARGQFVHRTMEWRWCHAVAAATRPMHLGQRPAAGMPNQGHLQRPATMGGHRAVAAEVLDAALIGELSGDAAGNRDSLSGCSPRLLVRERFALPVYQSG
jgi:hypothetical protein